MSPDQIASKVGQRVTPGGVVSYDFEGHVHAEGLDLDTYEGDAQPYEPPVDNRIGWLSAGGALDAWLLAYRFATFNNLVLGIKPRTGDGDANATVAVYHYNEDGSLRDGVLLLDGAVGAEDRGVSGFLRQRVDSAQQLARGRRTIDTNGVTSHTETQAHGLPATPSLVLATVKNLGSPRIVLVDNYTATTFDIQVRHATGGVMGSDTDVEWIAIG